MGITYHPDVDQGSEAWLKLRCGLLTASEMKLIITPTLKIAKNDKERAHLYELLAQRITGYVEPQYIGDDILRGHEDEIRARDAYEQMTGSVVRNVGFITNDKWGFTIGYSPDGLVDEDGAIEAKSRRQKFEVQALIECVATQMIPADYLIQCQTGLLVAEREWLDFLSYSGGGRGPPARPRSIRVQCRAPSRSEASAKGNDRLAGRCQGMAAFGADVVIATGSDANGRCRVTDRQKLTVGFVPRTVVRRLSGVGKSATNATLIPHPAAAFRRYYDLGNGAPCRINITNMYRLLRYCRAAAERRLATHAVLRRR